MFIILIQKRNKLQSHWDITFHLLKSKSLSILSMRTIDNPSYWCKCETSLLLEEGNTSTVSKITYTCTFDSAISLLGIYSKDTLAKIWTVLYGMLLKAKVHKHHKCPLVWNWINNVTKQNTMQLPKRNEDDLYTILVLWPR